MACLKLKPDWEEAAAFASAIRIDPEEHLPEFDRLTVFHQYLANSAGDLRLDLVHDLHRFDDAHGLAWSDPVAHLDVGLGPRLRRLVKRAHHRRADLLELGGRTRWPRRRFSMFLIRGCRGGRSACYGHGTRGRNRGSRRAGDHHAGTEPALHLDRADFGRFPQQLGQALYVLEIDGV